MPNSFSLSFQTPFLSVEIFQIIREFINTIIKKKKNISLLKNEKKNKNNTHNENKSTNPYNNDKTKGTSPTTKYNKRQTWLVKLTCSWDTSEILPE